MRKAGDTQLANQFNTFQVAYHKQNPSQSAQQVLDAYLNQTLGNAVGNTVGQTVTVLGKIPQAAATGAQNAANALLGTGTCHDAAMGGKILSGAMELIAVGVFAGIAGINKKAGQLALIFMIGFWLIWLVADAGTVQHIGNFVAKYTGNAA